MCFQHVNSVTNLELQHNSIQRLQEKTFWGLRNLKYLNLQNNVIDYIHVYAFQNPVICDCKLWGFRGWIAEGSTSKAWDINCVKTSSWLVQIATDFRCQKPAGVKVVPGNQTVRAGDGVSFTCQTDCMAGLNFTWVQPNRTTSSVETWTLEDLFGEDRRGFLSNYNRSCVSVLRLTRVSVLDSGSYTCEVTAPHMPTGTDTAFLTVTSNAGQKDNIITTSARPSSDGLEEVDYVYLLSSHDKNDLVIQPVTLHINVTIVCSHVVTVVAITSVLYLCLRKRNKWLKNFVQVSDVSGVQSAILLSGVQTSAPVLKKGWNSLQVYENDNEFSDVNAANGYETIPDYYNAQAEVDFVRNRTGSRSRATEDDIENHQYETIPDYVNAQVVGDIRDARYEPAINVHCTGQNQNECYNLQTIVTEESVSYIGSQKN
ncbi:PREDICTED: uncharacterized protein LOC109482848 [Branchiostoma belcheri]|uniref:Uncharacterized protein LOC109482848 n=1 Tax=Branchiostoma belcheri TaxID=7741 RepID=A0A6P5A4Q0_BRABE|nr:PREDICTED: uncharacterized protein LOC109482848 [Branchiostoma belcheri]